VPARQTVPGAQVSVRLVQAVSTQFPETQVKPSAQPPSKQEGTQSPVASSQVVPSGQLAPGEQSRSRALLQGSGAPG